MEENTNIAVSNFHQWETQGGNKIKGLLIGNQKNGSGDW
jgi:hypothetical protein